MIEPVETLEESVTRLEVMPWAKVIRAVVVVCERELNDARGQPLVQRQAFVVVGTTVAIVTATARAADKVAASAALDRVVASLASSSAGDL